MSEPQLLDFKKPTDFLVEVSRLTVGQNKAQIIADPHFLPEWFSLLVQTAIPEDARLLIHPVSKDRAGGGSYFLLMALADIPRNILALAYFYSPLFGLINETEADAFQIESLVRQLKTKDNAFSEACFAPMDSDSISFKLIKKGFKSAGWLVDDYFCFGNWYQPVEPGNYSGYLAERPSALKNTLKRAEKKLNKSSGFRLDIIQTADEQLAIAIDAFNKVYKQSWKQPEPYPDFISGLCQLAAQNGWLRLGLIFLDDQPIAAQLWLVVEKKAYIVKLAYDKKFNQTSAGTVLSGALFRHVIDVDRVEVLDYLIGDDSYKRDWMSHRRERRGVVAFNPKCPLGMAKAILHFAGKYWRKLQR